MLFVIVGVTWLSFKPVLAHAGCVRIFYTAGVGEIGEMFSLVNKRLSIKTKTSSIVLSCTVWSASP